MVRLFAPRASAHQTPPAKDTDKRLPSVQEQFVALRAVRQDVMCLAAGPTRTARSKRQRTRRRQAAQVVEPTSAQALPASAPGEPSLYRAVLALSSVNFTLKSSAEQEALLAGYHSFLNGLDFPIQTLVRVLPLDLEPYLQPYRARFALTPPQSASAEAAGQVALADLAADHARFVRTLAQRHTFLERRFYLVIPAEGDGDASPNGAGGGNSAPPKTSKLSAPSSLWNRLSPQRRRAQRAAEEQARFAAITQRLDLRVATLIRELARFGVEARRLSGRELVDLYYSCLSPADAAATPLPVDAPVMTSPATGTVGSAEQSHRAQREWQTAIVSQTSHHQEAPQ